jgi:regulator of replication initiation timing
MEAGITEDTSIQTVRRWFRERKISYKGAGKQAAGYILESTDQAFYLLEDAGVVESTAVEIVRRLLREGKIQNVSTGNRKHKTPPNETAKPLVNRPSEQEQILRQLKVKIKAQDEHIKGIEHLHQTSIATLIQQRDLLNKEIATLKNEKSELQNETKKLLKENIDLNNELLKLKDKLFKGNKHSDDKTHDAPPSLRTEDYRQKLGLSKRASDKEVLSRYKKLLKITHPDHDGNAAVFHFIKSDYDQFRNSINRK